MTTKPAQPRFIGLFTEDGLDQICDTPASAAKEKRDLVAMGCSVNQYEAPDELALYALDERMHDGLTFRAARGRVEQEQRDAAEAPDAAPETVQGFPVLAQHKTPAARATLPGRVVLLKRDVTYQPFVTCWIADGESSWTWGHYFDDETAARADFETRAKRGY